jgi:Fibronectin type III domain
LRKTNSSASNARRIALTAAAIGLTVMPSGGGSNGFHAAWAASRPQPVSEHVVRTASGTAGAPSATPSYYVYGSFIDVCGLGATTQCPLYADAAKETIPAAGGMTILDFGAPCFEPATLAWGSQLFNSEGCTPASTLVILAQAWLRGYETNPNRPATAAYVLVAGTSNSLTAAVPGNAMSHDQMALHGRAWFTSVLSPIIDFAEGLPSPVTVWAGDDIEQSSDGNWYDGPTTSTWVDAYATASGASKPCLPTRNGLMVDYGDFLPNAPGWSLAAVYHVSWEAAPACPMPEIYSVANASEWQSLNGYALGAGLPQLQFVGVLSENGADGTLAGPDSWNSLRIATGQAAPYESVIGTTSAIPPKVPDQPSMVAAVPGPGLVTLRWSAPAWDGGAAVTTYTVSVYAGSAVAQEVSFSGFPAPETGIVTGLDDGTSYTFYVSAVNRAGAGPQSLSSESVVPSGPPFLP